MRPKKLTACVWRLAQAKAGVTQSHSGAKAGSRVELRTSCVKGQSRSAPSRCIIKLDEIRAFASAAGEEAAAFFGPKKVFHSRARTLVPTTVRAKGRLGAKRLAAATEWDGSLAISPTYEPIEERRIDIASSQVTNFTDDKPPAGRVSAPAAIEDTMLMTLIFKHSE